MPTPLRTLWTIARHELTDSVRSRRVIVLILLYVAGSMAATLLFVNILQKIERQLAESLGVAVAAGTGNVTAALWKSAAFRHMMTGLAGNRELAERLLDIPPCGVFYGWLAFAFTPALVMLTSTARISEEIWSGSARFVLFRASRLQWCLGKFLGQAIQILGALLLSAAGAWLVSWLRMKSFEPGATASAMLFFSARAWVYSLAFLGLALAVSQWCSAPNLALALGFLTMIVMAVLAGVAEHFAGEGWRRAWDVLLALMPGGHRSDLWWGDAAHLVPATIFLLCLSFAYLAAGYARFFPEGSMTAALTLRGVVKLYGKRRALDGLDLAVPRGSIFGLVGSNGAGKTTAMAVSAGLLQAADGEIDILGFGPFQAETHAGRLTLLPQDSRFPPHARVGELLDYYARLQGVPDSRRAADIDTLLEWVHLQDRRQSPVRTLSHGMNRRLAIAQAFLGAPDLILLDEPLNGLDPREAVRVRDLIRQRRGHQTIVISSHHLGDLEALCDAVAFIELGRLVRQDTLDHIIHRSHRLTYGLTAPAPLNDLRQAFPDVVWQESADGRDVTAVYTDPWTAAALNAQAVPLLLKTGAGLLDIRRGSDLESEYLSMTPPPLPSSVPGPHAAVT